MQNQQADHNEWHVAPTEWEICNYDAPKLKYRNLVENYLNRFSNQQLKKKTFVTIAVNVLCANIPSSSEDVPSAERDLYPPLEISLTKFCASDSTKPGDQRKLNNKVWMINPGLPNGQGPGTVHYATLQRNLHKIDYKSIHPNDSYFRKDLVKVAKEINSMLTEDRVVFSTRLRNCRQDLGALKWLNREIGFKLKPIRVYSLEDLYVVFIRRLLPDGEEKMKIGQGIARFRFENEPNFYENKNKCEFHNDIAKENEDNDTAHCAKAITDLYSNVFLTDIDWFTNIPEEEEQSQATSKNAATPEADDGSTSSSNPTSST